jgi:hypothetical protein
MRRDTINGTRRVESPHAAAGECAYNGKDAGALAVFASLHIHARELRVTTHAAGRDRTLHDTIRPGAFVSKQQNRAHLSLLACALWRLSYMVPCPTL